MQLRPAGWSRYRVPLLCTLGLQGKFMPNRASLEFIRVETPITSPVTKFGGQPVWLEQPQWPVSKTTGNPMRFIAQIALDEEIFPGLSARMAYVFMTDEDEYVDGTWEPDGGENAVILQPGIEMVSCLSLNVGPTLYEMVEEPENDYLIPQAREYSVTLTISEDPPFQPETDRGTWTYEQFESYAMTLDGNKIGGSPIFLQGDEFPSEAPWLLLLQLDSTRVPFSVNFGDAGIAYAFVNPEGTAAKLLWQCA